MSWPSGPSTQPGGIDSPRSAAALILPNEPAVVAMSRATGSPDALGTAIDIGLVLSRGSMPPQGGSTFALPTAP